MPDASEEVLRLLQGYAIASTHYADQQGAQAGMHRTDLQALAHLMAAERGTDPLTPTALAERLSLSRPATSALLDRLESVGHVQREPDPADRRRTIVRSTPLAAQTARGVFGPLAEVTRRMAAGYDAEELALVARFLTDAIAVTRGAEGERAPDADGRPGARP